MTGLLITNYFHSSYKTNKATNLNLPFSELKMNVGEGGLVS